MSDESMVLAGDFAAAAAEEWDRQVLKAMNRGRPPGKEMSLEEAMKRLTTVLPDGAEIEPLYLKPADQRIGYPGQAPFTRGSQLADTHDPWVTAPLHEDPDVARTAAAIEADLNAGATGVWLRVGSDAIAAADVGTVLEGVHPEAADIIVSSTDDQAGAADALLAVWAKAGKTTVRGSLGIDPLASAALMGAAPGLDGLATWVTKAGDYPRVRPLTVDVTVYDNAGAGDIDQVAFALATGVEYVRALADQGIAPAVGAAEIMFRVAATADQFMTIARLRALRRAWARVGEVLEVPLPLRGAIQHAVTSGRIISRTDPWVNLLRATSGTFAAAAAGAEVITVLPHDTAYGLPTPFSRRVARNIALLTGEEAHVGTVQDPAGGAWTFEGLTEQIATKAWARLQEIEAAGGMSAALASGKIAEWVAATAAERNRRLATRKIPLTGVSMFPLPGEAPLTDFIPRPAPPAYAGLVPHRDSEVFEAFRDRSRAHEASTGSPPTVQLALLGARRDFGAREQFTTNLLAAGGVAWASLEEAEAADIPIAAATAGTNMVILASSPKVNAEQGAAAAKAAKAAGLDVWIAGRRAELADDSAPVDGEIFDGMDVVAFLADTLDRLGVAK